jgi:hypothetical protein
MCALQMKILSTTIAASCLSTSPAAAAFALPHTLTDKLVRTVANE